MVTTFLEEALRNATTQSAIRTDNSDVGIIIKYIGAGTANILMSTAGDIVFFRTTSGSTVTLDTSVSGGASGCIDVSNASYDTFGEVVDRINTFTNWRAVLVDALRSDSSNNALINRTRTTGGVQSTGYEASKTTTSSVVENLTVNITPIRGFTRDGRAVPSLADWQGVVRRLDNRVAWATGALQYRIYSRTGRTTETELARYGAGATNAGTTVDLANGQLDGGIFGPIGGELIVKVRGVSTLGTWTTGSFSVQYKMVRRAF